MKRIINTPDSFVAESLAGFVEAHADKVIFGKDRKYVRRRHLAPGKVAVISGG